MDAGDLAVWKYLREHIQRDAVVGIIEGGNEHQAICNIEVRVTGGQPLSFGLRKASFSGIVALSV